MLLAAGEGRRLAPLTAQTPKPVLPVANRPILEYCMRSIAMAGATRVLINTFYLAETVEACANELAARIGLEVICRRECQLTGPAGPLRLFGDLIAEERDVLVSSGDVVHGVDLHRFVEAHRESGALMSVVSVRVNEPWLFGVLECESDCRVVRFREKPVDAPPGGLVSAGIYCVDPVLVRRVPQQGTYDYGADLIPELVAEGLHVHAHVVDDYWNDVGSFGALHDATLAVLDGRVAGDWIMEPEAAVLVDASASVSSRATLVGPVAVGPGANIGDDAYLERTVVLPGASVPAGAVIYGGLVGCAGDAS